MYSIQTGEKDSQLKIKDKTGKLIFEYNRSEEVYLLTIQNLLFLKLRHGVIV